MSESDTDRLRAAIQAAVDTRGGRMVAAAADVTPDTLYRFLKGEALRATTIGKLAAYVTNASESDAREPRPADGGPLAGITRDDALVWRGRLMELVNVQRSATESMQALLRMFERSTEGVHEFVQSNVLPLPQAPTTQNGPEREAQLRAELDELVRRNREPKARAAGGGGG